MKEFNPNNHGPWEISHTYGGGVSCWQVYRLRDKDYIDHSGNREYVGPTFKNEAEARVWLEANRAALPD